MGDCYVVEVTPSGYVERRPFDGALMVACMIEHATRYSADRAIEVAAAVEATEIIEVDRYGDFVRRVSANALQREIRGW